MGVSSRRLSDMSGFDLGFRTWQSRTPRGRDASGQRVEGRGMRAASEARRVRAMEGGLAGVRNREGRETT